MQPISWLCIRELAHTPYLKGSIGGYSRFAEQNYIRTNHYGISESGNRSIKREAGNPCWILATQRTVHEDFCTGSALATASVDVIISRILYVSKVPQQLLEHSTSLHTTACFSAILTLVEANKARATDLSQ